MSGHITKPALIILICAVSLLTPHISKSQCCSTGSPVGASVYVGVLGKNYLRAITYYRHSYSDTYYVNDHKTQDNLALYNSSFNFAGIVFAYGVTKRLTIEIDAGYYFDKIQNGHYHDQHLDSTINYQNKGFGLSNGTLTFKYGTIIRPVHQIELTTGFGVRFPFSSNPQYNDGKQVTRDLQPSTNSFGVSEMLFFSKGFPSITLRVFSINRYDYNFRARNDYIQHTDYKYGNILLNSVFVSKKIMKYFFGILQIRNEWKTNDKDFLKDGDHHKVTDSGFDLVTVTPQLSYSIVGKWNLMASCDIPLYKYYHGKQMTPAYSVAISLTRDFNLGKKQPKVQPEMIK